MIFGVLCSPSETHLCVGKEGLARGQCFESYGPSVKFSDVIMNVVIIVGLAVALGIQNCMIFCCNNGLCGAVS